MKKSIFISILSLLVVPYVSFAALTTSEINVIETYVQNRSQQYTPNQLSTRSQRIINRIEYTFEVTRLNEFTTDILTYISQILESFVIDTTSTSVSTPDSQTSNTTPTSNQPLSSPLLPQANSSIASAIASFDDNEDVTILAWEQSQVVALIELNARLEPFELETIELIATNSSIQSYISQFHLYTSDGIHLTSDRPNSDGSISFDLSPSYRLEQWTTDLYVVIDTWIVGFNGNANQDSIDFELRISWWEASWVFSSNSYTFDSWIISETIAIQSVLITDIRFVASSEWARVSSTLTNGENTLAIIEITTAESQNNELSSPRDLDIILNSLQLDISDNTVWASARNSVILERLDRQWNEIEWMVESWDTVSFNFDSNDSSALITNSEIAVFRIVAENVQLDNGNWSVRVEINNARNAISYRSSDDATSTFVRNTNENSIVSSMQISD